LEDHNKMKEEVEEIKMGSHFRFTVRRVGTRVFLGSSLAWATRDRLVISLISTPTTKTNQQSINGFKSLYRTSSTTKSHSIHG
jgi:hypothetical protein